MYFSIFLFIDDKGDKILVTYYVNMSGKTGLSWFKG